MGLPRFGARSVTVRAGDEGLAWEGMKVVSSSAKLTQYRLAPRTCGSAGLCPSQSMRAHTAAVPLGTNQLPFVDVTMTIPERTYVAVLSAKGHQT